MQYKIKSVPDVIWFYQQHKGRHSWTIYSTTGQYMMDGYLDHNVAMEYNTSSTNPIIDSINKPLFSHIIVKCSESDSCKHLSINHGTDISGEDVNRLCEKIN